MIKFLFAITHKFEVVKVVKDGRWHILATSKITGKKKMSRQGFFNKKVALDYMSNGIMECLHGTDFS